MHSNHCAVLLFDLVQEINQRYPKLHLLLREDTTANLLSALRSGELDVLILALPVDIGNIELWGGARSVSFCDKPEPSYSDPRADPLRRSTR